MWVTLFLPSGVGSEKIQSAGAGSNQSLVSLTMVRIGSSVDVGFEEPSAQILLPQPRCQWTARSPSVQGARRSDSPPSSARHVLLWTTTFCTSCGRENLCLCQLRTVEMLLFIGTSTAGGNQERAAAHEYAGFSALEM
jgi:hypothetical protein